MWMGQREDRILLRIKHGREIELFCGIILQLYGWADFLLMRGRRDVNLQFKTELVARPAFPEH